MSAEMDGDDRRKRCLERARELVDNYKAERTCELPGVSHSQTEEASDFESFQNGRSMEQRESCAHEGISSRDITQSSVSMSEGEADGDLEGLAGRVAQLQELLQGKEAVVEALNAEIDHLRAEASSPNSSQSQNSSVHGRDVSLFCAKLQEFEKAINQRDALIEDLTWSLEQAVASRDSVLARLNFLNSMQMPDSDNTNGVNCTNLQEKIHTLEVALSNQKSVTTKLSEQLDKLQKYMQTLELEKETRNAEISDYKLQIKNLNDQICAGAADKNLNIAETLEQQKQYETRVDKIKQDMQHILEKFTRETNLNAARHQRELKELTMKHESEIMNIESKHEERTKQLKHENKLLADRLNKELPDLETRHAKELSVFQAQLSHYKKTVETLKLELVNRSEAQQSAQAQVNLYKSRLDELKVQFDAARHAQNLNQQKDKAMLNEQIELHKIQLEDMTSKYVAATAVLDSKESIERSLEQALMNASSLKQENDNLKFKLDDLSSRYSTAQSLIERSQIHERSMSSRIYDLEKSLCRLSGANRSTFSESNETTYQTFDEVAIQYQITKHKFEEKAELEKILMERITGLEDALGKTKEELEQVNLTKKSYEKQIKDMKNMCDQLKSHLGSSKEIDSSQVNEENQFSEGELKDCFEELYKKTKGDQEEIKNLRRILEQKEEAISDYTEKLYIATETIKKSEEEHEQLRNGLKIAWTHCAEVEEKLNQTLGLNSSKLDNSMAALNCSTDLMKFTPSRTNDSLNTTPYRSEDSNTISLQLKLASSMEENERLLKKIEYLTEKQKNYEDNQNELLRHIKLSEQSLAEKERVNEENAILKKKCEMLHPLKKSVEQLRMEKESLRADIQTFTHAQDKQVAALKAEIASEMGKTQSLFLSMKMDTPDLNNFKVKELQSRHAKEMEEVRTYFEQKCLQMEKQYSEEIFSQQSKKMSDNDSEIADLTDSLYYGAGGDCLTAGTMSRGDTPNGDENSKRDVSLSIENQNKNQFDIQTNINALRNELESKVVEMQEQKLLYERALEDQKDSYEREIYDLKEKDRHELFHAMNQYCQTEWDAGAMENGELSQLRETYNHQLEEQIALARLDIVNALQEQIQALLVVESDGEDNWPSELLELRDKFTSNAKREAQQLKEAHAAQLLRLKEEHSRNINRMIDRHQEELSKVKSHCTRNYNGKREDGGIPSDDKNIVKDRDNLNKMCTTLKTLVEELIKYFIICEEEVNNTLITEVIKRQLSESFNTEKLKEITESLKTGESINTDDNCNSSKMSIKRVHFAPQSTEITSIINSDTNTLSTILEEENITERLKVELKQCFLRLKSESAEILGSSLCPDENRLDALSKEIMWINKINEELTLKLGHAEALILGYQEETEQLKVKILDIQRKLVSSENKKEIITEGYGEHDETGGEITMQDFSQLQEKARLVLSNGGGDGSYLLQLIEELCRQSDKLMEDARKEKEDLQQQQVPLEPTPPPYIHRVCRRKIEAADKQLKGTRRFLDEQASEREVERDEAARQIHLLQDQLKEREREKERDLRINSESSLSLEPTSDVPVLQATDINAAVEALESQMRDMSSMISDTEAKRAEIQIELKAAVEKIWVLREIITDLEQQLQMKNEKAESLQLQINQLETVISAQTKNQHELVQELDVIKMGSESRHLKEHINHLEEELGKHKLSSEQFGVNSVGLKQMKVELRDMQNQLDKRIKDLESAHMCGSNLSLSQPSEDVSIREQIDASRCPTPEDPTSPPMLPLDQLLKLKEKMSKHARAEEVAFKRIKDLEMQVNALKNQNEELQAEQEILQQTASEQLFQIEVMKGRLEQHKQSAPFAQRQATSRLELQLHEANTQFQSLERTIADRDLEAQELKNQLNRLNQLLLEKEAELADVAQAENAKIKRLKDRLELAEDEKKILQAKIGVQEHAHVELPRLIDSMLADKNEEIDHLKEQLSKKDKQLEVYSSLAVDDAQIREMMRQMEPKNSARTLSDILSINSECEEMSEAIRSAPQATSVLPNISVIKVPTPLWKDTLDGSAIAPLADLNKVSVQVPPLDLRSHTPSSSSSSNAHSLTNSGLELKMMSPENNVSPVNVKAINVMQESLQKASCDNVQGHPVSDPDQSHIIAVKHTQTSIDETIKELRILESQLQAARDELQTKTAILDKREADITILQKLYDELQVEFKETVETLLGDKCFYQNQYEFSRASEDKIKKDLQEIENVLKLRNEEMQEHKSKMQVNEKIITELNSENSRLKKHAVEKVEEEACKYTKLLQEKVKEVQNLRDAILEKDITIESIQTRNIEIENENKQLYEFRTKYQTSKREMAECQAEIQKLSEVLNNRDLIIRRLEEIAKHTSLSGTSSPSDEKDQEIHHLQEYLKEKDKVIRQMSDDSKSLHRALETIQNKMKESGNIVELRKKFKDERKLNGELRDMLEKLVKELNDIKQPGKRIQDETDIEDMVQRELNLSAHLDRQILNAIETDPEDSGATQRQDESQQQRSFHRSMELKFNLSQACKVNEELRRLKDELEVEKSMLQSQIAEYEGRIFQLKSDLLGESKKVGKLDEELSAERNTVRTLRIQIERDLRMIQAEDIQHSERIEGLKDNLKSSMDSEAKLRTELSLLRQEHKSLEMQLNSMNEHLELQKTEKLPKLTELLEIERKKFISLTENFEKEERDNAELRGSLKRMQMEKNRYEKQLEVAIEEKEKLVSTFLLVEGIKDHLETDLKRTKEELKTSEKECEWLKQRIETMTDAEAKRQDKRNSEHNELKALRREINNTREVMMDLETDMKQSKRELTKSIEREVKLGESLKSFNEREADLTKLLSAAVDEEKKMKEMIANLQQDLKSSIKREEELSNELKYELPNKKKNPAKFMQKIKFLSENNEKHMNEKSVLRERLINACEENEQLAQRVKILESQVKDVKTPENVNSTKFQENLQYFYGKYLRVNSRRKALQYQKRYLLSVVGGYQLSEENTLYMLSQLTRVQRTYVTRIENRKNPKARFRSVVCVLISIHRMKWLILRWRTGKRVGVKTLMYNLDNSFLAPVQRATLNHSPPVKETVSSNGDDRGTEGFELQQYYQRLMNVQRMLGNAMAEPEDRQIIPE